MYMIQQQVNIRIVNEPEDWDRTPKERQIVW